jgi:hypothetical protein
VALTAAAFFHRICVMLPLASRVRFSVSLKGLVTVVRRYAAS